MDNSPPEPSAVAMGRRDRERVLYIIAAAAFLVLFQSMLVAPILPSLAKEFGASEQYVGLLVPAYLLPYGISSLFYGPISDRSGRKPILLTMFAGFAVAVAGCATARSVGGLLTWRVLAGLASGGIVPIGLALLSDIYPYRERGRPIGWVFGALAGGTAFGSTLAALLNPVIGWRAVLLVVAGAAGALTIVAWRMRGLLVGWRVEHPASVVRALRDYRTLATGRRARWVYGYIFFNAVFHSGVYSWLGLYLSQRFGMGDQAIGLALIGYGVPGMLLGPVIGRAADKIGRERIIPVGLAVGAIAAAGLAPSWPIAVAVGCVTLLSLGYDMSHPLLAGIVTSLDPDRRGQAIAFNAFALFTGFGAGSLLFQLAMLRGFGLAMTLFAIVELIAAVTSRRLLWSDVEQSDFTAATTPAGATAEAGA